MKSRPISASSMKTYLQCVLKYYLHYEEKKPRPEKTNALTFGTALHKALEEMHRLTSETGKSPDKEVYDYIVNVFMDSAAKGGLSSLPLLEEGKGMLISRLDNIDPTEKILGLELGFELETPAGTPFKGSIDKLVELDETTVAIIDYKSSKIGLTREEADEEIQLSMYDLAVSMMYPQYTTIVCAFDYLRMGEVITHRTPEQRDIFVKLLDAVYKNIRSTKKEDVKPSLNMFCGWCDYKSYCPAYASVLNDPDLILPRIDGMTDDDFVTNWEKFDAAKKIVDTRYRELKDEAHQRLMHADSIKGKEFELYKTQSGGKSYNTRGVFKVVGPEKFVDIASVGKNGVERFVRDNPHLAEDIESTSSFSLYSPIFKLRKLKPTGR